MAEPITFKGRSDHLEVKLAPGHGLDAIKRALKRKLEANRHFFEGTDARVSISDDCLSSEERNEIAGMLKEDYQISLLSFQNVEQDAPSEFESEAEVKPEMPEKTQPRLRKSESTLFVYETLRSGRRIAFDGDVVVLGDVNSGAEVVASGCIVIMGVLRGLAHAGAQGDETATISSFSMQAKQLRISGHIAIVPDEDEAGPEFPEVARVCGDAIEVAPYRASYSRT